jgi:DNA-binding response OmpR family regulator
MSSAQKGGVLADAPSARPGQDAAASGPGRFTRVSIQTAAGEIEARLSEMGNWELRVRRDQDTVWRLACAGDIDCGIQTAEPVCTAADEPISCGDVTVEPTARRATVMGKEFVLARKEFELLRILASAPDRVYPKAELLRLIWGDEDISRTRTLDTHASRLRRKLRQAGADFLIVNRWGFGYGFWDRADVVVL